MAHTRSSDVAELHRKHPVPHRRTKAYKLSSFFGRVSLWLAIAGVLAVAAAGGYFLQR